MTARDVIAAFIFERYVGSRQQVDEETDAFLAALLSAPESVRQELAALLDPWRPIETAPSDDPFESIPVPLKTRELGATISRAQHGALMAAAQDIRELDAENQRLKTELEDCDGAHQRAQIAERRVRELEANRDYWRNTRQDAISADIRKLKAERDEWKQCAGVEASVRREFKELLEKAEAERDWLAKRSDDLQTHANAIQAKTIEECAACAMRLPYGNHVAMHIRALAQKDKATSPP